MHIDNNFDEKLPADGNLLSAGGDFIRRKRYEHFLENLPYIKDSILVRDNPASIFGNLASELEASGFTIAAIDEDRMRVCGYRSRSQNDCTCIHVAWIKPFKRGALITYAVEPRFGLFWLCPHGDHLEKMERFRALIHRCTSRTIIA